MTDSLAALTALADKPSMARDEALHTFYERAKANKEALVINKWLSVQACARSGLSHWPLISSNYLRWPLMGL